MTELEKMRHLNTKYKDSDLLFTVYRADHTSHGYEFTLIYGSDERDKVRNYVYEKEQDGKICIVYCARLKEKSSTCVHMTGYSHESHLGLHLLQDSVHASTNGEN